MIEAQEQYVKTMVSESQGWGDVIKDEVLFVNCRPDTERLF